MKAVFGSWGLRNARLLAPYRKERPPRAPLHEQRKKATLNAAHERRHTAGRPACQGRPPTIGDGLGIRRACPRRGLLRWEVDGRDLRVERLNGRRWPR